MIVRLTPTSSASAVPLSPASSRSITFSLNSRLKLRRSVSGVGVLDISSPRRELSPISVSHPRGSLHDEGVTSWDAGQGLLAVQWPNTPLQLGLTLVAFAPLVGICGYLMSLG